MPFLRLFLLPMMLMYGFVVYIRNVFFDYGLFTSKDYSVPIISIGNLCSGGSGKSPLVEYILRLIENKEKVAVLSRGYGRDTRGFKWVTPKSYVKDVLNTLFIEHPYEEVAFELQNIDNINPKIGSGLFGQLTKPLKPMDFLNHLKKIMQTECIRYTNINKEYIQTVAVCGGSGSFLLNDAKKIKADIFITADYKYHQFFDAENDLIIADIGHYESEQFTKELICEILNEKFTKFATHLSSINTNPINYL